ncbi:RNA polymerase sigma factor [Marinifilum fragile]|uniref:RNA polymerase sigma factor n=1 Tax=Marinifilum fragile TaxID=570161 RepID=UPI0006CFE808|nr:sigma-70 family RNA polymerase sigma factor [Marinifilum fragile]
MNQKTDEEILQLFQDKKTQSEAFSLLVKKYQERLYWQIRKIVLSHDDADDVLQNTFVKIWKGLLNFRYDAKLFTWMYRIATNESLTFLKDKQRRSIAFANKEVEDMLIANMEADEYFDGNQAQIEFQKAILQLPEKQRLVFNMKYFDEMKYEDMSEILETSVGALKASYHHAVKKN